MEVNCRAAALKLQQAIGASSEPILIEDKECIIRRFNRPPPISENFPTYKELEELYEFPVQLYKNPAGKGTLTLELYYEIICERLSMIAIIIQTNQSRIVEWTPEYIDTIERKIKLLNNKYVFLYEDASWPMQEKLERRFYDHCSHYIIRYSFYETLNMNKFVQGEEVLIRLRFRKLEKEIQEEFYKKNELKFEFDADSANYKIYFTDCLPLVKTRIVELHYGYALIPIRLIDVCIAQKVTENIRNGYSHFKTNKTRLLSNDSFIHMNQWIKAMADNVFPNLYTRMEGLKINFGNIKRIAYIHFPPCMRNIYSDLFTPGKHLKHYARQQLTLFFKGIGASSEFVIELFFKGFGLTQEEFTKRKYAYYIKHAYGEVGGKINYQPYTCQELQKFPNENYKCGCPFEKYTFKQFTNIIRMSNEEAIQDIEDLMSKNKYSNACACYLNCSRAIEDDEGKVDVVSSPNGFFEKSIKLAMQRTKETERKQEEERKKQEECQI